MSFLASYKRLDNLCKDMYSEERGVTSYIENMKYLPDGSFKISGWDTDYQKLVHYRSIRNKIVHDNNATEDNMSDELDIEWIENFRQRILSTNDPLAQYQKALKRSREAQSKKREPCASPKKCQPYTPSNPYITSQTRKHSKMWVYLLSAGIFATITIFLIYFFLQIA